MKLHLSLDRKLFLLAAIPLAGVLLFAGAILLRLGWEAHLLNRLDPVVTATADLVGLRRALAAEQADTWDLYTDPSRHSLYPAHIHETDTSLARLHTRLEAADASLRFSTDIRRALSALASAGPRLAETRAFFRTQSAGGDRAGNPASALRAHYAELAAEVVTAIGLLNQEATSAALRSRLDGFVWFGHLAEAAEIERTLNEHGFTVDRLTIATLIDLQNATSSRRYFESNALLMAAPELVEFWSNLRTAPAYARADQMRQEIFDTTAAESQPFRAGLRDEWSSVTRERRQLLAAVEPHLLGELRSFLENQRAFLSQQIQRVAGLALLVLSVSLGVAFVLVRRLNRLLRAVLARLNDGVTAIVRAVHTSSKAATRLAQSASREAAGLEETGAALVTLTSVNQHNVDAAAQTADLMTQTGALVGSSRETMRALADTMQKMSDSSNATSRIVKTINEISFQTSILALNASIEAASAGAAGTGFAVVADEVRSLAGRASDATAETSRLVEESNAAIARGGELTHEVEHALADLETNAAGSAELMHAIHASSQQMLTSMQHINTGSRSMETVTQQNAAIAEHNATTAGGISSEAARLQSTITRLEKLFLHQTA